VAQQLAKAGYEATSLQGNLSQNRRQAAMDGFRDGSYQILVATDIAARGIDVEQISHVINYDIPDTVDAYTHRIGRTGRAARTGDAYTLVTREDNDMIRAIEAVLKSGLERRTVEGFDYKAPRPARDVEFARPPREPRRRQPVESYGEAKPRRDDRPRASAPAPQRRTESPADFEFGTPPAPKPASRPSPRPTSLPTSHPVPHPAPHTPRNGSSAPQRQGDSQDTNRPSRKPQRVFPNNPHYKPYR
jgi:ATP-dependent RNA helicase RhlE